MGVRQTRAGLYQSVRDFTVKIGSEDFTRFVGAGFVVAPDAAGNGRIVTCAHVVQAVQSDRHWGRVGDKVGVRFLQPYYNAQQDYVATVRHAFSDSQDDVVLLQLDAPAPLNPNKVAVLGVASESHGHTFVSFGFRPMYQDFDGAPAEGVIYHERARVNPEKHYRAEPLVLDSRKLKSGMSGAAVLDLQRNVVVGIVSMVKDDEATALAVDVALLREFGLTVQDEDEPLRPSPLPPSGEPPVVPKDFPAQLRGVPPVLPEWTGREALLAQLTTDWLNPTQASVSLIGLAGEGKTSLARQWLETLRGTPHAPYAVFWWSFYADPGVEHFLEAALEFLGVPKTKLHSANRHPDPDWFIHLLLRAPHRVLFVLDGVERVQEDLGNELGVFSHPALRHFLQAFTALDHPAFAVLTSRLPLVDLLAYPAHHALDVTRLTTAEGRVYLRGTGVTGTDAELDELVRAWEGHALTLNFVARYVLDDCGGEARYALKDKVRPEANVPAHRLPLRAMEFYHRLLEFSDMNFLELHSLFHVPATDEIVRTLFRGFQVDSQTGGVFERKRSPNLLNKLLFTLDDRAFAQMMGRLTERRLVRHSPDTGQYTTHPLVQAFYAERLEQEHHRLGVNRAEGALTDIGNYYAERARAQPANTLTLADLIPHIDLYRHLVRAGRLDEARELFRDRLTETLYFQFGAYQTLIELLRALFLDGEDKPPRLKSESAQGWTLNTLANSYSLSGQPRRAAPAFEQAAKLAEKQGDKKNLASGLGNFADDQLKIGSLRAAEANLQRSIALLGEREIGDEFREAVGHMELGRLLAYLGAWADAEQELDTAWQLFEKQKAVQSQSVVATYRALRALLMARAEPVLFTVHCSLATASARRALALAEEREKAIGRPNAHDFIRAHWLLGASLRAAGEFSGQVEEQLALAETHLSEALQRCRAINMVDTEAEILLDMARLHATRAQGVAGQNSEFFKNSEFLATEALAIAERCGYVLQAAEVHLFLAGLALQTSEVRADLSKTPAPRARTSEVLTSALDHAREALRLATCDGEPYVYRVAYDEAKALVKKLEGL